MRGKVLVGMLAVGALLRLWTMHAWRPAFIGYYDTAAYVQAAHTNLFGDPFRPAGYPLALRLLHAVSPHVSAITLVQHALGLATALLLYLIVSDRGWWALLAPAVILFDGFQILIEHAVLSDTLFVFLLTAAIYCALRPRLAPLAGALLAGAVLTRTVGLFVVPFVLLVPLRRTALLYGVLAFALVVGVYVQAGGRLAMSSGWGLYARVGQIADCTKFTPPRGTQALCETSDPSTRQSSDFYYWSPNSPAQKAFGAPPAGDNSVGAFAHAVVRAQPLDYLDTVATDFSRYVAPGHNKRPRAGETQDQYLSQAQRANETAFLMSELTKYYEDVPAAARSAPRLTLAYTGRPSCAAR